MLNVCYPEQLFHIVNTGSSGNTVRDLENRWVTDVLDLKPDRIVVCIGFNDVWRQFDSPAVINQHVYPDEYREALCRITEKTMPSVKSMIFMTPYYMETNKEDRMRKRMDEYGAIMKEVAARYVLPCIDLQKEFDAYLQYRHSSYIMWDRVHPGWIGSMIIARAFLRTIGFDRAVI
ncbi:Acetylxylan esterase [bioreactor metagenome]|uniref:Acetylxylan esterase n=1 Tax=bioreactor metagenome TaxID=1076179 RepID=A0A645ILR1_9ZZZZ